MPTSISQHRTAIGAYQNRYCNNFRYNSTLTQSINSNFSSIPDEVCLFGKKVRQAINVHQKLHRPSSQSPAPQPGIVAPILMLLSMIRITDSPLPEKINSSVFVSDEELSLTHSGDTAHQDYSDHIFSTLLSPVVNTLYETGNFISQYDPLTFPGTEAIPLSLTEKKSNRMKNINFLSDDLTKKIRKKIDTITDANEKSTVKKVIKRLNRICIEAEKKFPSDKLGYRNIEHLIYLIDKSKAIIDDLEIKYTQESICHDLRSQQEFYIEIASDISDDNSALKFKAYIESIPSLTFTPDSRGKGYPSVESQIAGNLVRSFFWFENDQGHSAIYGHRYDAYKSLLTCILAEKNIGNANKLPDTWYKGNEAIRLVNLLFRDLEYNLKNKGIMYFLKPAEIFYLSLRKEYLKDSTLDIAGLEGKTLSSYSDKDKLLVLIHYINQPVEIEYNQEPKSHKLLKIIDFFMTMQSISSIMHSRNLSVSHPHRLKSRTGIRGNQSTRKTGNLHFKYDDKNQELTIQSVNGRNKKTHLNSDFQIQESLNNKKIKKIKLEINSSLKSHNHHSYISKEIKNKISPDMYAKNIRAEDLSPRDHMGIRYSRDGSSYLKINNGFVKIHHMKSHPEIKNRYFIKKENKDNLYLRFRKDNKFHLENYHERLEVIKKFGLGGKTSKLSPPSNDLTRGEIEALYAYGRANSFDINDLMREEIEKSHLPSHVLAPLVDGIEKIQHALKKIPPYEGVVYHGTSIKREHLNSLHSGQIVTNKAFFSCSTEPAIAELFTRTTPSYRTPIIYEFNIRKSGHPISDYTLKPYEKEILIENSKYFKIRSINANRIILDEIDDLLLSDAEKAAAGSIDYRP